MTLQATRDLLAGNFEDHPFLTCIVKVHEDQKNGLHYEVMSSGQVMISVVTARHGIEVWAILGGGDNATGVWSIPAVGTEVVVGFDGGSIEGEAYIIGKVGRAPSGLAPDKVIVVGSNVEIRAANVVTVVHEEGGSAESLAKTSELQQLADDFYSHVHLEHDSFPTAGAVTPGTFDSMTDPGFPGTDALESE